MGPWARDYLCLLGGEGKRDLLNTELQALSLTIITESFTDLQWVCVCVSVNVGVCLMCPHAAVLLVCVRFLRRCIIMLNALEWYDNPSGFSAKLISYKNLYWRKYIFNSLCHDPCLSDCLASDPSFVSFKKTCLTKDCPKMCLIYIGCVFLRCVLTRLEYDRDGHGRWPVMFLD